MNLNIISKYRNEIYGFSIIWIVLFHGTAINNVDYSFGFSVLYPLQAFLSIGNVGVDIFLFLSGVCLYFSFAKSKDIYLYGKKRLLRIVPPVLIIYGVYWIVRYGVFASDPLGVLSRFLLIRFWLTGDQTIYFASLVLFLYLLYPYIHAFLFTGERHTLRLAALLTVAYVVVVTISLVDPKWYSLTEIALTRIPVFILGSYFGKLVYEGKSVNRGFALLAIFGSLAFLVIVDAGILHGAIKRYFYLFGGICFSYAIALLILALDKTLPGSIGRLLRTVLSNAGVISFEVYLAHIMTNQVLRLLPLYKEGDLLQYVAAAMIAFVIACVSHRITNGFAKKAMSEG